MSIRCVPDLKLAITAGAYTLLKRLPNLLRNAAVATTTSEPSGSCTDGRSTNRSAAGKPCPCRTGHIAGSHDTMASQLTCAATQAAVRARRPPFSCATPEPAAPEPAPWLLAGAVDA